MEQYNYFLPSEVARLVLGYLKASQHKLTYKCFLKESEHLAEYAAMLKKGTEYPTTIMGVSLLELLEEYAELKLKDREQSLIPIDIGAIWKQFDAVTRTLKQKTRTHSVKSSCHQQRQRTKKRVETVSLAVPPGQVTLPTSRTTVNSSTGVSIIKVSPLKFTCKPSTSRISVGKFQNGTNVNSDRSVDNAEAKNTRRSPRIATRSKTQNKTCTNDVDNIVNSTVDNTVENAVDCDTDIEGGVDMDCDPSIESSPSKDDEQPSGSAERNDASDEIAEPPRDISSSGNSSNRSDAILDNYRHSDSESEETAEASAREEKHGASEWVGEEDSQQGPKSPTVWLREVDPHQGLTSSSSHTDSHALHIVNESPVKRIVPQEHRTPVKALIQDSQTCDTNMTNGKSPRRKKQQPKRRSDMETIPGQPPRQQPPEPRHNSSGNTEEEPVQSDPFPMLLDKIMNDTKLHERLAETINKKRFTDHSQTPCQKPVATSAIVDEFFSPENPNMLSEDTIDGIISMTTNDPVFDSLLSMFGVNAHEVPQGRLILNRLKNPTDQETAKKHPPEATSSSHSAAFHINTVTECVPDSGMMELSQDGFTSSTAPGLSNPITLNKTSGSGPAASPVPSLTSPCPSVGSVTSSVGSPGHAPFQKKRRIKPIPCNPVTSALPVFSSPVMQELSPVHTPEPAPLTPSVAVTHTPAASPAPPVPAAAQQVMSVSSILASVVASSPSTSAQQPGPSQTVHSLSVSSATSAQQPGPSQTVHSLSVSSATSAQQPGPSQTIHSLSVSSATSAQQPGSSQTVHSLSVSSATSAQQPGPSQTVHSLSVSSATSAQQPGPSQTVHSLSVSSATSTASQQTVSLQTSNTPVASPAQALTTQETLSVPAVHAPIVSVQAVKTPSPDKVLQETISVPSIHTPVASPSESITAKESVSLQTTCIPDVAIVQSSAPQQTVSLQATHTPGPTAHAQQSFSVPVSHAPAQIPVSSFTTPSSITQSQLMPPPKPVTTVSQTVVANRNNSNSHSVLPSLRTVQPVPVSRQQVLVLPEPDSATSGVNINIQENGVVQTFSSGGTSTCQQVLPLTSFPSVSVIPSIQDSGNVAASSFSVSSSPTNSLYTVTALPGSIVPSSSLASASSPVTGAQSILNSLATGNLPPDSFVSSNSQMSLDLLAENNLSQCAFASDEQKSDTDDNLGGRDFPTVVINNQLYAISLSPNGKNCQVNKATPLVENLVKQRPTVTVVAPSLPQIKPPASKTSVKKPRTKSRKKVVVVSPKHPSPSLSKLQDIVRQQLSPNPKNSFRPNILSKSPQPTKTLSLPSDGYFISPSRSCVTDTESTESSATNEYVAIPLGRLCDDGYKKSLTFEDESPVSNNLVDRKAQSVTGKNPNGTAPALPNKIPMKGKMTMRSCKASSKINGSSVLNVDIATSDGTQSCIMSLMSADGNMDIRKGKGGGRNKTQGKKSTKKTVAQKSPVAPNISPSSSGSVSVTPVDRHSPSPVNTANSHLSVLPLNRNSVQGSNNVEQSSQSSNDKKFVPLGHNSLSSVQVTALKQPPTFPKEGTITTMIGSPKYANSPGHFALTLSEDSNLSSTSSIQTALSDPGPIRPIKGVKKRKIIAKTLTAIPELKTPGQTSSGGLCGSRKTSNRNFSLNQNSSGNDHKRRKVPNLSKLNVDDFLAKIHQ